MVFTKGQTIWLMQVFILIMPMAIIVLAYFLCHSWFERPWEYRIILFDGKLYCFHFDRIIQVIERETLHSYIPGFGKYYNSENEKIEFYLPKALGFEPEKVFKGLYSESIAKAILKREKKRYYPIIIILISLAFGPIFFISRDLDLLSTLSQNSKEILIFIWYLVFLVLTVGSLFLHLMNLEPPDA